MEVCDVDDVRSVDDVWIEVCGVDDVRVGDVWCHQVCPVDQVLTADFLSYFRAVPKLRREICTDRQYSLSATAKYKCTDAQQIYKVIRC